jgi:pyruvate formate lyase activating enzyme
VIGEGKSGFCRARINKDGRLFSSIYGETTSIALDPIEKKPLYHFFPTTQILSLGPLGCSFSCVFCQNWHISQDVAPTRYLSPDEVVRTAKEHSSIGIAYTYSEPLIWYEYVLDTSRTAREEGLKNVLVTNGYINEGPLQELLPFIDAMNLDIKSFNPEFYKRYCSGELGPVLKTAKIAKKMVLLEVTNLVIPTLNDGEEDIRGLVDWVAVELGRDTPLHFSRYFPHYKLKIEPTPISTLMRAWEIATQKLDYVYVGNIMDERSNTTFCPKCRRAVIRRLGYQTQIDGIKEGQCSSCGTRINIVM